MSITSLTKDNSQDYSDGLQPKPKEFLSSISAIAMKKRFLEASLGAVVLVMAVVFIIFAYSSANVQMTDGYPLTAEFNRIDGINRGADVRMGGVKIGTVTDVKINNSNYRIVLTMNVHKDTPVPENSAARILAEGLMGSAYVDIQPGGATTLLKAKDQILYTQEAINLVDLLGRFIFSSTSEKQEP